MQMCQLAVDIWHIKIYNQFMTRDIKKLFAEKLITIRQERKLTQEDLALLCGIDRTHIGRIERLERNPGLEILDKIALGLKIPLGELLDL